MSAALREPRWTFVPAELSHEMNRAIERIARGDVTRKQVGFDTLRALSRRGLVVLTSVEHDSPVLLSPTGRQAAAELGVEVMP